MKLEALIQKISLKRQEDYPFPDDLEGYFDRFVPNVLLKQETLQKSLGISAFEMEEIYEEAYQQYSLEEYQAAGTTFRWLVLFNPFIEKYWMGLGCSQMLLEEYEKALHSFAIAALLNSDSPMPHYYAFECYRALHNQDEALKALHLAKARAVNKPEYKELEAKMEAFLTAPST